MQGDRLASVSLGVFLAYVVILCVAVLHFLL